MITLAEHRADLRKIRSATDLSHTIFMGFRATRRLLETLEETLFNNARALSSKQIDDLSYEVERRSQQLLACAKQMRKLAGGSRG